MLGSFSDIAVINRTKLYKELNINNITEFMWLLSIFSSLLWFFSYFYSLPIIIINLPLNQ